MDRILLAGSTGYLGSFIAKELFKRNYNLRVITRNEGVLKKKNIVANETIFAELTKPETLVNTCQDIDVVISTVGITRQKDGLTYMDVDYKANKNLLDEARKNGVKKFIYVSVLNGEKLRNLKICEAKEKFVDDLKNSGLDYCIIRPNGFFSDLSDFYNMAKKGKVYLFGDGSLKGNPISGQDLSVYCVEAIESSAKELSIGGPQILTQNEIATSAFKTLGKKVKIIHLPDWIRKVALYVVRNFTSQKTYGPVEFFLTVMAMEMIAPEYGKFTLEEYFSSLS
jgi:uncharacterized protein YbjT (DUF2867 family)